MEQPDLIPHLFRTEFRKITAVLTKLFGIEHIAIAEDIASETFLSALETWPYKGIPANPTAWLYSVAKNKAKNHLQRQTVFSEKIVGQFSSSLSETGEMDWSEKNILDSQLQMLFALCHPSLSPEAQIGLSLRILCGFGIDEIADAFLTNKETINKRLFRAREKLRTEKIRIEFPKESEISKRLEIVLTTLYLLFNEGYYSTGSDSTLRKDICLEAMYLTHSLLENAQTNRPEVNALFALMCFHSSRFDARQNENGEIILYHNQDETLWNYELIYKGAYFLHRASQGEIISKYHLEASIAYWFTIKAESKEKWNFILQLYNQLLRLEYSPIAALNRLFSLSKVKGKQVAIIEAEKLNLTNNCFYFSLLGELYKGIENDKAKMNFQKAFSMTKSKANQQLLQKQIDDLTEINTK